MENDCGFAFEMEEEGIDYDSDEYQERRVDSLCKYHEQKEKLNGQIEDFLKKIDEEHGTSYCPTKIARTRLI